MFVNRVDEANTEGEDSFGGFSAEGIVMSLRPSVQILV